MVGGTTVVGFGFVTGVGHCRFQVPLAIYIYKRWVMRIMCGVGKPEGFRLPLSLPCII